MAVFGNTGRLLRVDLTTSKSRIDDLDGETLRKYVGGKCLGTKILFDEVKPRVDPLDEGNRLIFVTGPLQGTTVPGSGRFAVVFKSALTGGFGEAHGGGTFGPFMKMAGYDAIVVQGSSPGPVSLYVSSSGAFVEDASTLWGRDVWETEKVLRKPTAGACSIVSIGPAGERLVRISAIINDLCRAAARGGPGAVMGSKKLKAIVVQGRGKIPLANEKEFMNAAKKAIERIRALPAMISRRENGTPSLVEPLNSLGILPTRNFREGAFIGSAKIDAEAVNKRILVGRKGCYACPVACGREVEVRQGAFAPVHREMGGPEYETLASFGSLVLNEDIESIAKANEFCNLMGIDTISAGVVVAFAMECYEKGILTKDDLEGLELRWGDARAMLELLEKIASNRGIGGILSEGVKRASEKIGEGSESFAMQVKGLEFPLHEGRGKKGVGFLYAVGNGGSKHLEAEHDTGFERPNVAPEIGVTEPISRFRLDGQAHRIVRTQSLWALVDSLILCKFIAPIRAMTFSEMVELTDLATGRDYTLDELLLVGERAINLGRAFNVREGFGREDDCLPPRMYEPLAGGASAGHRFTREEFEKGLDDYYQLRGWNLKGQVTKETLLKLGMEDVAEDLETRGYF